MFKKVAILLKHKAIVVNPKNLKLSAYENNKIVGKFFQEIART